LYSTVINTTVRDATYVLDGLLYHESDKAKDICAHWDEVLRLAASIKTGTVTASLILKKLANYPRQNGLAKALREIGKIERTLFGLQWY
jgi:TnpA family transposase